MELNSFINALGWTIINSLWQGMLILLLLSIFLVTINPKFSRIRSMISYAALIIIFAASVRTFIDLYSIENDSKMIVSNSSQNQYSFALLNSNLETSAKLNSDSNIFDVLAPIAKFGSDNSRYIVAFWLLGILLLSIKMAGGFLYLRKLRTKNLVEVRSKWHKILLSLSTKFQISKNIKLFESHMVKFPTVIGYLKPVVLMPIGSISGMTQEQVELIFAHELAHIKRADYLLNLIQSVIEILFFFNPFTWIISKIINTEREYACDDLALEIINDSTELSNALLHFHQNNIEHPAMVLSAMGNKNTLFRRIKRMKTKDMGKINYPRKIALASLLVTMLFTITFVACSSSVDKYNDSNVTHASIIATDTKDQNNTDAKIVNEAPPIEEIDEITQIDLIDDEDPDRQRNFSFHNDDDFWKGEVKDRKLVKLYKNGKRISKDDFHLHQEFVLNTLDELDDALADLDVDLGNLKVDLDQLKIDLSDLDVNVDMDGFEDFNEHFNSKEFKKEMKELKESLKDIHIDIGDEWKHALKDLKENKHGWYEDYQKFNSDEFKNEMENLKHELKNLTDHSFKFDFDFDSEEFKESMKSLKESMKDLKVNMKDLDIDLSDLKIDLSELKVEMKKLKGFMNEFRNDLLSEGIIDSYDEDFDLRLNKDKVVVDGKTLSNDLHNRYLDMYKKHFGKELEESFVFHK